MGFDSETVPCETKTDCVLKGYDFENINNSYCKQLQQGETFISRPRNVRKLVQENKVVVLSQKLDPVHVMTARMSHKFYQDDGQAVEMNICHGCGKKLTMVRPTWLAREELDTILETEQKSVKTTGLLTKLPKGFIEIATKYFENVDLTNGRIEQGPSNPASSQEETIFILKNKVNAILEIRKGKIQNKIANMLKEIGGAQLVLKNCFPKDLSFHWQNLTRLEANEISTSVILAAHWLRGIYSNLCGTSINTNAEIIIV